MSVPGDNDAGRLYNVLEKLKSFKNNAPYAAFAQILNEDENNRPAVYEYYSDLLQLSKNVKNMIDELDTKKDIFFHTIDSVINAICIINFLDKENGLQNFKTALDGKALAGLEFTSLFMSDKFREKKLEQSILDGLHNDIIELMEEIERSNIDSKLKVILERCLNNIKVAIAKYDIFGANGINDALEKSIGAYVLAISEKSSDTDEERSFLRKIYYKICGFSNVLTSPQTVYLIAPPVILGTSDKINNVGKIIKNIL